jgi:hypothetical protein
VGTGADTDDEIEEEMVKSVFGIKAQSWKAEQQ